MDSKVLKINEIYYSIQGESSFSGLACLFIRLTGCNLRCVWCDSSFSFYQGEEMAIMDIISKIKQLSSTCQLVEITGGEPLLQKNCSILADKLLDLGYTVLVETSGSLDIDLVSNKCHRIVDFKCPASKMDKKNDYQNIYKLTSNDELKFVVSNKDDFKWVINLIEKYQLYKKNIPLLISPSNFALLRDLTDWVKKTSFKLKISIQLHKVIWEDNTRAV